MSNEGEPNQSIGLTVIVEGYDTKVVKSRYIPRVGEKIQIRMKNETRVELRVKEVCYWLYDTHEGNHVELICTLIR